MRVLCRLKSIVQFHVGVERVVLRACFLFGHRVVERCRHLCFVREELSQLKVGCETVCLVVVGGTLGESLFKSAESLGHHLSRKIDGTEVGQLHVERTGRGPSTLVVELEQPQFVYPYLARLHRRRYVAHTDHHRLHLAERRVADDAYLVVGFVVVVH